MSRNENSRYISLKELKIFLEIMKRKIGAQKTREIFEEFKQERKKL